MANRVVLAKCPYCGEKSIQSHGKYLNMCDICGKRYGKYHSYRTLLKTNPTAKREQVLIDLIAEYRILRAQGFRVPSSIEKGL